jgi:DNA helicase II / ATP-dependent DNA helicase PcrA
MPSPNHIIIASAGSGKTTTIVDLACAATVSRSAIVTYTTNNSAGIEQCIYAKVGHIPPHLTISTWYSFLLRHLVRPYQKSIHPDHVRRLHFHNGISAQYVKEADTTRHYFGGMGSIYVDKVSKFACQAIQRTGGKPILRLEDIFDHLYIDEVQDLAGWDLELIEHLMKSRIAVTLVGDHRQATYSTNSATKNKKYAGAKIINKFDEWKTAKLCEVDYQCISHRCVQTICDLADKLHPTMPKTTSFNKTVSAHDGVFAVRDRDVAAYMAKFEPQTLRYSRATKDVPGEPLNYGAAKGLTYERTLIFPNNKVKKFLLTGDPKDAGDVAKIYVAITRARQSTAFVISNTAKSPLMSVFQP